VKLEEASAEIGGAMIRHLATKIRRLLHDGRLAGVPALAEKLFHQATTLLGEYTFTDLQLMIVYTGLKQTLPADNRAVTWLGSSKNQCADSGMNNRAKAHGARLDDDIKRASRHTIVLQHLTGVTQGTYFGMSAGIVSPHRLIESTTHDFTIANQHGPNRDFTVSCRLLCQVQRLLHVHLIRYGLLC